MAVQGQILWVKIFKKIRLEIREKFHFEIWANFDHSEIFNSVEFQISKKAKHSCLDL